MKSILVIDDESLILNFLSNLLTRKGYLVDTAESGKEGIKKIDENKYALIITDIEMPGISGNEVIRYLRNGKKSSTPVIGISGTPWRLKLDLFDAALKKPCLTEELLSTVRALINE